ncbi:hypothetical protein GCM10010431_15560 [Streptomyces kunmingensis]
MAPREAPTAGSVARTTGADWVESTMTPIAQCDMRTSYAPHHGIELEYEMHINNGVMCVAGRIGCAAS